jgi:hypothetical protein
MGHHLPKPGARRKWGLLFAKPVRGGFRSVDFQFTESTEGGIHYVGVGQSEFAMTGKLISLGFILPTALAIGLGILLSIGAVYLADHCLGWLT